MEKDVLDNLVKGDLNDDAKSIVAAWESLERALNDLFESPRPHITVQPAWYHAQESSLSEYPAQDNHQN